MGVAAVLADESLTVEPGGAVVTRVRVRNTGEVVDQFLFEALGDAAPWAAFDPPTLSLLPDDDGIAEVRFAPPRHPSTRAGTVPFGIRVASQEDPGGSVVAEGDLTIGRFDEVVAELVPRTARGRTHGSHELAVQNRGNSPLRARVLGVDPERRVRFSFNPPEATARPGGACIVKVEVRPRRRFLRGASITHPYTVRFEPREQPPLEVPGAYLQEPLIPKWVPRALLALAALIVAWLVFLKPTVQSTATDAVQEEVKEQSQLAASQAVSPALAAADERLANVEKAVGITPGEPLQNLTTTTVRPGILALGEPVDARLEPANGNTATASTNFPDDQILSVTDLIFENGAGDTGRVSILRGSQVLLSLRLETFRDLDYHFVSPIVFPAGTDLTFRVDCERPAPGQTRCTPALTVIGLLRPAPQE